MVVANAGVLGKLAKAKDAGYEDLSEPFQVNTLGPIVLYQATYALLHAAANPKFFIISSSVGSIGYMENMPVPALAYGMSKAAVNYFAKKAHTEDDKITVVAVQPGWVQTTMGGSFATQLGMNASDVPVPREKSVSGLMKVFHEATKERTSGTFPDAINGGVLPW